VEPGDVELRFGRSSAHAEAVVPLRLIGGEREVDHRRRLLSHARVEIDADAAGEPGPEHGAGRGGTALAHTAPQAGG
jgi:beta-glucosidase